MKCVRFVQYDLLSSWSYTFDLEINPCSSSTLVRPQQSLKSGLRSFDLNFGRKFSKYQSQNEPNQNKLKISSTWASNKNDLNSKIRFQRDEVRWRIGPKKSDIYLVRVRDFPGPIGVGPWILDSNSVKMFFELKLTLNIFWESSERFFRLLKSEMKSLKYL